MTPRPQNNRLGDLLHQAAQSIPDSVDVTATVQQRIHHQATERQFPMVRLLSQVSNLAIGSLIVLIVIAFIGVVHFHVQKQPPLPAGPALIPGLVQLPSPVIDQGIQMQVIDAYVDAIHTTIRVAMSSVDSSVVTNMSFTDPLLTDERGQTYAVIDGISGGYTNQDSTHSVGLFAYFPFSPAQLQQPLRLTFTVRHITNTTGKSPADPSVMLAGNWHNSFVVNPAASIKYQANNAPTTTQGISMQVQSVEVAPSVTNSSGQHGGIRLIVTLTGLPSDTLVASFAGWKPSSDGFPQRGPVCLQGQICETAVPPTVAMLSIPGFIPQMQGTNGISLVIPPTNTLTVGSSGTVQMELLFAGQGIPTTQQGTLTITNLYLFTQGSTGQLISKQLIPTWKVPVLFT